MAGISKRFPGVNALAEVDFTVEAGEVHALLGENGAGKSTLLKILSGAQTPDRGTVTIAGARLKPGDPLAAQAAGIAMIYQEFSLAPALSVAENIFLGREPTRFGFIDRPRLRRQTQAVTERLGLAIDPRRPVAELSVAEQQLVEICRALSVRARLIVMDEPTSALSEQEVGRLLRIVDELRRQGLGIIYVTHRLEEVMRVCDRCTVLRDGRRVGHAARRVSEVSVATLIEAMVGRDIAAPRARHGQPAGAGGPPLLAARGLSRRGVTGRRVLDAVDLELRRGEILGLAGLVGAGRSELARLIFGADPIARGAGELFIEGRAVSIRSPRDAIRLGIGLVPEDRKRQALFLSLAVGTNLSLAALDRVTRWHGLIDRRRERALIDRYREALRIRMGSVKQPVAGLSGGNQQKVVLARWLALQPRILIVDEPTRGIDVAAKSEVHQLLFQLAATGIGVIVISSELPEILLLSDRIATLCEGRLTGVVDRADASEEQLMALMAFNPPQPRTAANR